MGGGSGSFEGEEWQEPMMFVVGNSMNDFRFLGFVVKCCA